MYDWYDMHRGPWSVPGPHEVFSEESEKLLKWKNLFWINFLKKLLATKVEDTVSGTQEDEIS